MGDLLLPCVLAMFVWWFGTGAILYLDGLAKATFRWSLVFFAVLAIGSLICINGITSQMTVASAYGAFICTIFVWAFVELSFLTGLITGPNKKGLPATADTGSKRFMSAFGALLYHELAILACGMLIIYLSWGKPNQVASSTYLVLWIMRTSAKLNLFLGVRNQGIEFLPPHLKYLQTYFKKRRMNWLFPISIIASTTVAAALFWQAVGAQPADTVGNVLVATLLALALLEHWFMVLPFSSHAMWQWAVPKPKLSVSKATL